jgi:ferrous iron transport protein A
MTLDALPNRTTGRIRAIHLAAAGLGWLRAVGIFEGERVTVLRRAVFGGPLHLRTGCGGEFALDRGLAASIDVEPEA